MLVHFLSLTAILALLTPLLSSPASSTLTLITFLALVLMSLNYVKIWNHVLLMLLTLEALMLALTFTLSLSILTSLLPLESFFTFFTLAVVEASLAIATLISYSRMSGSEFLSSIVII